MQSENPKECTWPQVNMKVCVCVYLGLGWRCIEAEFLVCPLDTERKVHEHRMSKGKKIFMMMMTRDSLQIKAVHTTDAQLIVNSCTGQRRHVHIEELHL